MLKRGFAYGIKVTLIGAFLLSSVGCVSFGSRREAVVVLHPILNSDLILLEAGQTFTAPASGAFLTDTYITEVMQAKIGK